MHCIEGAAIRVGMPESICQLHDKAYLLHLLHMPFIRIVISEYSKFSMDFGELFVSLRSLKYLNRDVK